MNKNKKVRLLIKFFIFILSINIFNFKTAPASETFLEELGFQKKLNILSKSSVSSDEKKETTALPRELIKIIFNKEIRNLRLIAPLNHEWNDWAQSRLTARKRLYGKLTNYPKEINYLRVIFNFDNPDIMYHNMVRGIISSFSTQFKFADQPVVKENETHFLQLSINYKCEDQKFDFLKLVRAYTEYQSYEEAIKIINILWEAQEYLTTSFVTPTTIEWFNKLHIVNSFRYTKTIPSTCISFITDTYYNYCKDFLNDIKFEDKLGKTVKKLIELNKLILCDQNLANNYYNNYPNINTKLAFQFVEVDLSQNTFEVRTKKLATLKQKIVKCAQEYFIPAEVYISIIQRQLNLG